jgi:hypothetical protein
MSNQVSFSCKIVELVQAGNCIGGSTHGFSVPYSTHLTMNKNTKLSKVKNWLKAGRFSPGTKEMSFDFGIHPEENQADIISASRNELIFSINRKVLGLNELDKTIAELGLTNPGADFRVSIREPNGNITLQTLGGL